MIQYFCNMCQNKTFFLALNDSPHLLQARGYSKTIVFNTAERYSQRRARAYPISTSAGFSLV